MKGLPQKRILRQPGFIYLIILYGVASASIINLTPSRNP